MNTIVILATAAVESVSLTGWPAAFAIVGGAFAAALFYAVLVTGRYPWDRK